MKLSDRFDAAHIRQGTVASTIISSKVERSGASRPLVAAIGGRNPQTVLRPPCSNG